MKRYLRIWWIYTKATTQIALQSRFGAVFFLVGKFLRFGSIFYFLYILVSKTQSLAGYNLNQVLFFYATFNLIDGIPQFLLREVYRFRNQVVKGYLDYVLAQPQSTLLKALFGGSDVLDLPMLFVSVGFLIYSGLQLSNVTFLGVILYLFLLINGLAIALAFHIFVLGLGIVSTEVDNSIMLYRDITRLGQIPVDVYRSPISLILTFIVPVGIMMSFPVKALLGLVSLSFIVFAIAFAGIFLFLSLKFWRYALNQYQSASS